MTPVRSNSTSDQPSAAGVSGMRRLLRRTLIAVIGCGAMALSGSGLAGYLTLSTAAAATPPVDADAVFPG